MDLELAPDDAVPEPPAPRSKTYVRDRYKVHGWATPPGNLVAVYLEACERHRVPANSAVIAQLHRRVRLMQSGPWQRVCPPASEPPTASPSPSFSTLQPTPLEPSGPPSASASRLYSTSSPAAPSAPTQPLSASSSAYPLGPVNSHEARAAAAQTCSELRDLILSHVYPLTLGSPALRPGTAGGTAAASELHASTLGSAAFAMSGGGAEGPLYAARAVSYVCQLVDPRTPWEQLLSSAGLPPGCHVVSEAQFRCLLETASAAAGSVGELRQAALEVLQRPVGHNTLDVEGMLGALFDYLDVTGQGSLPASEVRSAVVAFSPGAAADMEGLAGEEPVLGRRGHELVSRSEFVSLLAALAPSLAPPGCPMGRLRDQVEIAVNAMMENKIRDPYVYDFSRCYLGPRGLLPVLDALGGDAAFCGLGLAHCGLGCGSAELLAGWLRGHPCLTSLDLSHNLIGDRGGLALTRLLRENSRIVELGIGSTALLPPRPSRTHHCSLGPSACEDAGPLLAALGDNRAARRSAPGEIVRALRQHGPELRAMCYSLLAREESNRAAAAAAAAAGAGGGGGSSRSPSPVAAGGAAAGGAAGGSALPRDGRVPLESLRAALGEVVAEWGFTLEALDEVLQHERLLGTATAGRTADASGRLGVSWAELMAFLRAEDRTGRVARAFRNRLPQAKQIFYSCVPQEEYAGGAGTGFGGGGGGGLGGGGGGVGGSGVVSNGGSPYHMVNRYYPTAGAGSGVGVGVASNASSGSVGSGGAAAPALPPPPPLDSTAVVSGPRTALSTVRQAIIAAASQPGSGWDVSEADLEAVLSVGFLRAHMGAAEAGGMLMTSAGAGTAGAGGSVVFRTTNGGGGGGGVRAGAVVGPDGLLVPEWRLGTAGAGAGVGRGTGLSAASSQQQLQQQQSSQQLPQLLQQQSSQQLSPPPPVPSDMLISWPELCNTLLYLFNR
ncbi:hypothetical protein Agub_g10055 [Astrephomene gubernaculifera]|uniref:Uncharacterized protein n=1 Tax=Astrephomene gubernaculifera TaxID=47775 RepID=A0AAD3DUE7_9CHLO|nr:hypothetical protein Agub_g10055 [Astrephomene gubernaculifera]